MRAGLDYCDEMQLVRQEEGELVGLTQNGTLLNNLYRHFLQLRNL